MTFLIALRVLLSVSASALQKRLVSRRTQLLGIWTETYAIMLPFVVLAALATWKLPSGRFLIDSALAGFLDALGNLAMIAALRAADLSVFGPLNAIRPILALVFGWIFLKEVPNGPGVLGILITVAGAGFVLKGDSVEGATSSSRFGGCFGFRLLGFSLSTVASVFLKRAASEATAEMTLLGWISCGLICLVIYGKARKEGLFPRGENRWLALHAAAFLVMQWLTIKIFQTTLLSLRVCVLSIGNDSASHCGPGIFS